MALIYGPNDNTLVDPKNSVKTSTTAALPANTRVNNRLTANANGALAAQDGITLALEDRLLVKNEAAAANNGLYKVSALGSGGTPWILDRVVDADQSSEVTSGLNLYVSQGTANGGKFWTLTTVDPIILNTTSLVFTQTSSLGGGGTVMSVTAGAGLVNSGTANDPIIDAIANADGSLLVNANDMQVGVLATDAQHGTRGGGTQHTAVIAAGASGFMTGADKTKLDGVETAAINALAGAGMTRTGSTLNVIANADGSIIANADDVQVGVLATNAQHGNRGGGALHADATTSVAGFMSASDKLLADDLRGGTVRLQIRNQTGATLLKGRLVSPTGVLSGGIPLVQYADKDDGSRRPSIAFLDANLPDATSAYAVVLGRVTGLDTSAYSVTDQLVLGTNGALSRPPPDQDPFTGEIQSVASVAVVHATQGELIVSVVQELGALTAAEQFFADEATSTGVVSGGAMTRGAGRTINITSGIGFVHLGVGGLTRVSWGAGSVTPAANATFTVYVNSAGAFLADNSFDAQQHIILGTGWCNASTTLLLSQRAAPVSDIIAQLHEYTSAIVGNVVETGIQVTESGPPSLQLDVDSGSAYFALHHHTISGPNVAVTFRYWYRDGIGGWTVVTGATAIDPNNYDNGTGILAAVPLTQWKRDLVFVSDFGSGPEFDVVFSQATFATQALAEAGSNPTAPNQVLSTCLRLASVITQRNATDIGSIVDQRPFVGQFSSGSTAVTDHGLLGGLADDDHPQYQLRSEKGAASGYASLDGTTRLPAAQLPTTAVIDTRSLAAGAGLTGGGDLSANRTFDVVANADGSIVANANDIQVGILATDAQHGVRGGGTQHSNVIAAGAAGFMSGTDKSKLDGVAASAAAVTSSAPANVTKAAASVGVATDAARADHKHDITTATAANVGTANSEGSASSLSRSDHVHNLPATAVQSATAALASALSVNSQLVSNVATPVSTTDAATKGYVDALIVGFDWKEAVRAVATSNVASLSGTTTIDGVSLVAADRVLLTAQSTASQNGLWLIAAGAWTRPTDFAIGASAASASVFVAEGTTYADTAWVCITNAPNDVVNTNSLAFTQFSSSLAITNSAPADVTKAAAVVGVASTAARSDHKHDVTTAAPTVTAKSTSVAASEGTATTLMRSDAQIQIATVAPTVTVKSEATAAATGSAFSMLRSDAQIQAATAAPGTQVLSDASTATQGSSSSLLRADARLIATTATAASVGVANTQGSSTSLSRADHVHASTFPVMGFGARDVNSSTTTRYLWPWFEDSAAGTTVLRMPVVRSGTIRNFYVYQNTAGGNGNTIVYTIRKNGVATAVAVTIASNVLAGSDTSNSVSVAAGDTIDIEVTKASSVGTSPQNISANFEITP